MLVYPLYIVRKLQVKFYKFWQCMSGNHVILCIVIIGITRQLGARLNLLLLVSLKASRITMHLIGCSEGWSVCNNGDVLRSIS